MSDDASEVRKFVNAKLKSQKIRAEHKEQVKDLKDALDETKFNLMEAMDAARVSSVQSGIREWVVVYEIKKSKPLNVETLGSVLSSVNAEEVGTGNLSTKLRSHVMKSLSSYEETDDEITRSFRIQNHCPAGFKPLSDESKEIMGESLDDFKEAFIEYKSFTGMVREKVNAAEKEVGPPEVAELAAAEFVMKNTPAPTPTSTPPPQSEGSGNSESGVISGGKISKEDGGVMFKSVKSTEDEPLFLKTERKFSAKQVSKRRFFEIVNSTMADVIDEEYGSEVAISNESVQDFVSNHSNLILERVSDTLSSESVSVQKTRVTLTTKKPKV